MNKLADCWHCNRSIEAEDAFCRFCGKRQGQTVPFRYTHAGIIILTLLVGPLALPFIWKSPIINKRVRVGYCVLNLLITVLIFWSAFGIYNRINREVGDTLKLIEQSGIGTSSRP
jgi:hypothetical protein